MKIRTFFLIFYFIFALCVHTAPAAQDHQTILEFVQGYIAEESKDSDIISIKDPSSGIARWFEVYGILNQVVKRDNAYGVLVDVTELGNDAYDYLVVVEVEEIDGKLAVANMRLAQRHTRDESLSEE